MPPPRPRPARGPVSATGPVRTSREPMMVVTKVPDPHRTSSPVTRHRNASRCSPKCGTTGSSTSSSASPRTPSRTTSARVPDLGQVETDEVYVAVRNTASSSSSGPGERAGTDQIGAIQVRQDLALCRRKFPGPQAAAGGRPVHPRRGRRGDRHVRLAAHDDDIGWSKSGTTDSCGVANRGRRPGPYGRRPISPAVKTLGGGAGRVGTRPRHAGAGPVGGSPGPAIHRGRSGWRRRSLPPGVFTGA